MPLDQDLLTSLQGIDRRELLRPFRWLFGDETTLLLVTALGDLFVSDRSRHVKWLDVGSGRVEVVADDEDQFWARTNEPKFADVWFGPELVSAIRRTGLRRGVHDCYCFVRLPMLGGEREPLNFTVRHVAEHVEIWGPILEKVWSLPDGTKIRFKEGP